MSTQNHFPDNWVVLKIKQDKLDNGYYRVLAGWSGGYVNGDAWRINSGIKSCEKDGDYYKFKGYSGSVYICHQNSYRLSMATAPMLNSLLNNQSFEGQVSLIDSNTNWLEVNW